MPFNPFTDDEENQLIDELNAAEQRVASIAATATPTLAETVTEFFNLYPNASPWVAIPTAKAYAAGTMDEKTAKDFLASVTLKSMQDMMKNYKPPKKKSWFERNVSDKAKGAVRWGQAGLQWTQDVGQGIVGWAGTQAMSAVGMVSETAQTGNVDLTPSVIPKAPEFNPQTQMGFSDVTNQGSITPPEFTVGKGGFKNILWDQTLLGTMVENPDLIGTGWMPNARIWEKQAEEARQTRGTINGSAATGGRLVANLVMQPGTLEYNVLSGLVDMGVALSVPAIPGGGLVADAAKLGAEAVLPLRIMQGLQNSESTMIIPSKVSEFLRSSGGQSIIKRLTKVNTVDEAMEIFPTANAKFWTEVVDAKDETAVAQLLNDTLGLGDVTRGIGPRAVDDINISRWDTVKREFPYFGTQKESKVARLMADLPGQHVIIAGGSEREVTKSIRNVKNYLRAVKVPADRRAELIDSLTKAFVEGDNSIRNVVKEIETVSRESFKSMGVNDKLNDLLHAGFSEFKVVLDRSLYGEIGDLGTAAEHGATYTWIVNGKVVTDGQPLNTAMFQSEALKHSVMLADPRQVRRIASQNNPLAWVTTKQVIKKGEKFGELRIPFSALEFFQNDVWRPMALATGGYVFRNMSDSLLRQSFAPNIRTGLFHPFELIQVAMFKRFKGDIWGTTFKGDPEDLIRLGQREMAEAAGGSMREARDPLGTLAREQKTGVWRRVEIGDGLEDYSKGVAAEVALAHDDQVARMVAEGMPTLEILKWMENTDEGKKYVRSLQNIWTNRTLPSSTPGNKTVGSVIFIDRTTGKFDINNLTQYIENSVLPRIEKMTGGDKRLKDVISTGSFTDANGDVIPALMKHRTGEISGYSDEFLSEINKIVEDPNIVLKKYYKSQVTGKNREAITNRDRILASWDKTTDIFFGQLYPKREAFLNRSPVFRQQYYSVIKNLVDELQPGEAKTILRNIENAAKEAGEKYTDKFLARYVGDSKLAQKLLDKGSGKLPSNGKLTFEELDAYAKGYALDETKKLFYNAAEKSNFADVFRIIAPFGSAWAEVTKNWAKTLATNPEALKKSLRTVQGLKQADPDADGRGFFYKDPISGEYVFNYPMSEHFAPWMTGVAGAALGFVVAGPVGVVPGALAGTSVGVPGEIALGGLKADMVAPAKSLNMGLQLSPGVGPYVQVLANKIIPQKPSNDWIRKLFIPYGEPDVSFVTMPSWLDKMWSAYVADPENDRIFGDIKMSVMEALTLSGDYDLKTLAGAQKLEDDANLKARVLLGLRALGQFTGPTRPVPQVIAPLPKDKQQGTITIDGEKIDLSKIDIHGTELSKYFRQLQTADYDTAVRKFMDTFGEDAFLYMAGKTKSTVGGLDASQDFAVWERNNSKFFTTYKEVAGYFAPVGTKFDYQVYTRQIELGLRERLQPDELVAESQRLVGTALYREVVRSAGPNPNAAQKEIINQERAKLEQEYPGFARTTLDVNQFKTNISVLYEAAFDSRMDDNPVAQATREYLAVRDSALAIAEQRGKGLGTAANADLRTILRNAGEQLVDQYPEFARIWDRLLFQEVDIVKGE
jgi:hypothetical protein